MTYKFNPDWMDTPEKMNAAIMDIVKEHQEVVDQRDAEIVRLNGILTELKTACSNCARGTIEAAKIVKLKWVIELIADAAKTKCPPKLRNIPCIHVHERDGQYKCGTCWIDHFTRLVEEGKHD